MATGETDLKSANAAWLWSIAVLDAVLLLGVQQLHDPFVGAAAATFSLQIGLRGALTAAAPVVVLLLTSVLPAEAKSVLVFWRLRHVLPSHRAFSLYSHKDPRISLAALRENAGKFPRAPHEQSSRWYQLYRKVEADVSVRGAHRHYLLFRDLAAMSVILLIVIPLAFSYSDVSLAAPACGLFGAQFLLSAIAARHNGIRMVTTVLALHSVRKYE